ncbi:hypothetical protein [Neobacillus sp. LXY-4]|uniref:hypothetical protein n=1 Tax=Neobacillus sp. LXY-4 TaxID=3379826 RepID=UPI003EE058EC
MSEYKQFLIEREQIDSLIQKGYKIFSVNEDLNGSQVEFLKSGSDNELMETLHIISPGGRKYFSVKLLEQQNH